MEYASTRDASLAHGLAEALERGLAPDGGLYVPREWPLLDASRLDSATLAGAGGFAELAARVLEPFAAGSQLERELGALAREAFDFPVPLVELEPGAFVLELFHGPTAAFKDLGARFLAAALARLRARAPRPLLVLVATSGDTGGAVAAAFHGRPGFEVAVLYPEGRVSPLQERQLTALGGNVRALAVRGSFDDCQRILKESLADASLRERFDLSTANSINLGRLLPQLAWYAAASVALAPAHGRASFVVPSGNLGNATACLWARRIGLPIGDVVLAHNANRAVPDLLASGAFEPRPSVATLASAMDVGDPSNLERVRALFPTHAELRAGLDALSIDDAAIAARIRAEHARGGRIFCPHTAAAAEALARLPERRRARAAWVVVATAHPAKFAEVVAPLVGRDPDVPPSLARLPSRAGARERIGASSRELVAALLSGSR